MKTIEMLKIVCTSVWREFEKKKSVIAFQFHFNLSFFNEERERGKLRYPASRTIAVCALVDWRATIFLLLCQSMPFVSSSSAFIPFFSRTPLSSDDGGGHSAGFSMAVVARTILFLLRRRSILLLVHLCVCLSRLSAFHSLLSVCLSQSADS